MIEVILKLNQDKQCSKIDPGNMSQMTARNYKLNGIPDTGKRDPAKDTQFAFVTLIIWPAVSIIYTVIYIILHL